MTKSSEYRAWHNLIQRCTNPRNPGWKDYGGRGITVCQEWRNSFGSFFETVGPKPSSNLTLDRINNSKGYEPGNVRWASSKEQVANSRPRIKHCSHCGQSGHNTVTCAKWRL